MRTKRTTVSTDRLVLAAVLTAIVVILQVMAILTRAVLPVFAINLVLIPIVIGAAIGGVSVGAWLGFISGVAILISGDATAFLSISIGGTLLTVLLKGTASGFAAAGAYKLFEKKNRYLAVFVSALVCPVVNTGIFVLGCLTFFMDTIRTWGEGLGYENAFAYIFLGMIGVNFIIEVVLNLLLSPSVIRLLEIKDKK
jgi:uncharacterized membrane protein